MRSYHFAYLLPTFIAFTTFASCTNNPQLKDKTNIAAAKDSTGGYTLPIPAGWTTEKIIFPINFAPQINYDGTEDLRFAEGWEDIASEEHWTYAFLWYLDGKPVINDSTLQQNLTDYYSGLVKSNIDKRMIPAFKVVPTVAKISTTTTAVNDIATFSGTIKMLDYIAQTPMTLNAVIHLKNCSAPNKSILFFQISPKPTDHAVWKELNKLNEGIICK